MCNDRIISGRVHLIIQSVTDLSSVPSLWRQFYEPMYNIIATFSDIIPPPRRK